MFERTELLIGKEGVRKLRGANVLVVGLGGVGAYAAEMLCRAGVGKLTLVDADRVSESNLNRQLVALRSTLGELKTEVLAKRLRDINESVSLNLVNEFLKDEALFSLLETGDFDYVVDAIDTLSPKLQLVAYCAQNGIRIVSSMGSGGKFDPSLVQVADISRSFNCPLARMLRKRLHKVGVYEGIAVVFSPEEVPEGAVLEERSQNKRTNIGTISYMPAVFGCFASSVVIRELIGREAVPKQKDTRYYHNKRSQTSDITEL